MVSRSLHMPEILMYPGDDLLYSLLMTLHIQEGLDLAQREILPISKGNDFVKSAEKFKCMFEDFSLIQ